MLSVEESNALLDSLEMWEWIAKTGSENKIEYFISQGISEKDEPIHRCYLCEATEQKEKCLVEWGEIEECSYSGHTCGLACLGVGSAYQRWGCAYMKDARQTIAEEIVLRHKHALRNYNVQKTEVSA